MEAAGELRSAPALTVSVRVPRPFGAALLKRSSWIWLVLRAVVTSGAAALGEIDPGPDSGSVSRLSLEPSAAVALVFLVAGLAVLDARRRNEATFLANLGVSGWSVFLLTAVPPAALEIAMAVLL